MSDGDVGSERLLAAVMPIVAAIWVGLTVIALVWARIAIGTGRMDRGEVTGGVGELVLTLSLILVVLWPYLLLPLGSTVGAERVGPDLRVRTTWRARTLRIEGGSVRMVAMPRWFGPPAYLVRAAPGAPGSRRLIVTGARDVGPLFAGAAARPSVGVLGGAGLALAWALIGLVLGSALFWLALLA